MFILTKLHFLQILPKNTEFKFRKSHNSTGLNNSFGENRGIGIRADENTGHVGSLVPFRLAGHIVMYDLAVYYKVLETDIGYFSVRRIAAYYREFRIGPVI